METITLQKKRAGSILFEDGLVDITDPSYDNDDGYRTTNTPIKAGTYNCYAYICTKGDVYDIGRCFIAQMVHNNYNMKTIPDKSWKKICSIFVDTGRAGFFSHKPDFSENEWFKLCDETAGRKYKIVKSICKGFVTSSGYGDGKYDVYAYYQKGEIVALEIRY